jgi:hypothetical protein
LGGVIVLRSDEGKQWLAEFLLLAIHHSRVSVYRREEMRSSVICKCLFVILVVAMPANLAHGAIRPSFMLKSSAWEATDIVVASDAGLAEGRLTVIESWKGRLAAKDTLVIADLQRFADKAARTVQPNPWQKKKGDKPAIVVTGKRMILFLKRASSQPENQETARIRWEPAGVFKTFDVAVVWVEGPTSYSFVQVMNPGPSLLMPIDLTEAKLKAETSKITEIQESLARIAVIPSSDERAAKAAAYLRTDNYDAYEEAYRIMVGCKKSAVPILRKMLADRPTSGSNIIDALAATGGSDVAPEFVHILNHELEFWKSKAPSLQKNWWNGQGLQWSEVESLRDRYCRAYSVLRGLRQMHYQQSRNSVQAFRNYWTSLPNLDEIGNSQLTHACDDVLESLKSNGDSSR